MRVFKRGKSWYVDYRVNGKRFMKSFGRQKNFAEVYLKDLLLKEFRGDLQYVDNTTSIDSFFTRYLEYCRTNKAASTCRTDVSRLRIFRSYLEAQGIGKLKDISPYVLEEFKSDILRSYGPVTFNRYLQLAKAMLSKATEWGMLRQNPLSQVKLLKNTRQRQVRFFTTEEIEKLLQNSTGVLRQFIQLASLTGMRRSEVLHLKWSDIDLHNKLIDVQSDADTGFHPKGYRPRTLPVSKELERILLDLPQTGRYVFDNGKNRPLHCADYYTKGFEKLLKRLGIDHANLHTLRHTFASYLVMGGVDIRTVQQLLGHSSVTVTERYAHLSPVHLQKAAEALRFGNKVETI
ncbi:MAG: tyrosine-type recombinase/integrase [Nitrospira sp.]|nr:tyrosine-type recombinase/integrase [Nitrospira sp.]